MSTIPTNRESDRFMLRLPDGMRDRIKAAAEQNSRSMNAEIVATLYDKYPPPPDPEFDELYARAMEVAPEELSRFMRDLIQRKLDAGEITEDDIADGLVPGVVLANEKD